MRLQPRSERSPAGTSGGLGKVKKISGVPAGATRETKPCVAPHGTPCLFRPTHPLLDPSGVALQGGLACKGPRGPHANSVDLLYTRVGRIIC